MGTLGNQPPRDQYDSDLKSFILQLKQISEDTNVPLELVVEAERCLQMARRNSIAVQDGDYRDEQVGGLGEILRELAEAIRSIREES